MKKTLLLLSTVFIFNLAFSQVYFSEDFDGIGGPTAGGAGTYTFPSGWLLRNVDNMTPASNVAYVNEAWERREDFNFNVSDSVAFSSSWGSSAGTANDWMWTPAITVLPNTFLKWNAVAYDPQYPDGYEVRIMVAPDVPTGGTGIIGNQITNSTVLFSTAAENTSWTAHQVDISSYAGQTVRIAFRNNSVDQFVLLIDDVQLQQIVNYDLSVSGVSHGEYTVAPSNQLTTVQNIELKGTLISGGTASVTNAKLGCDVFLNGTFLTTVQSVGSTITSGASELKTISYSPTLDGLYTFKFFPVMDQTDQNILNDTLLDANTLTVTPNQMRRDNGQVIGSLGIGAGTGGFLGQTFNFENPVVIESISAYMTRGYVGRNLYSVIYSTDASGVPTAFYASSDTLVYPDDSARLYTMPIHGGSISLPSGKYAFLQVEIDSTLALGNTSDIFTTNTVFVNWSGNPFGTSFTPIENFGTSYTKPFVIYPNFDVCFNETGGLVDSTGMASCGGIDGYASVSLDPGYSITWDDNSTNAIHAALTIGYHTYSMTNGTCSFTDSVLVENPPLPTATVDSVNDALCHGGNGQISIAISNGSAPYSVIWSDGSTQSDLTAVAGTYTATITDSANCTASIVATTITEPAAIVPSANSSDESCSGCNNGTASVTPSGGNAPYIVSWSNGSTGDSISNLAPGTYTATITDASGCSETASITIAAFVGIDEWSNLNVHVYPNPTQDFLVVVSEGQVLTNVRLLDNAGKIVFQLQNSQNQLQLNTGWLSKGTYQLIVETEDAIYRTSVIKE